MSYQIPQELVEITRNRIQKEKTLLLDAYDELYHKPEIKFSPRRIIRKINNKLSDFSVYVCTFGTTLIIRETEEESYKRTLTLAYQEARQKIDKNTPQIADAFLMALFKLEKETDILKKIMLNFTNEKLKDKYSFVDNNTTRKAFCNYNDPKIFEKLEKYQNQPKHLE